MRHPTECERFVLVSNIARCVADPVGESRCRRGLPSQFNFSKYVGVNYDKDVFPRKCLHAFLKCSCAVSYHAQQPHLTWFVNIFQAMTVSASFV